MMAEWTAPMSSRVTRQDMVRVAAAVFCGGLHKQLRLVQTGRRCKLRQVGDRWTQRPGGFCWVCLARRRTEFDGCRSGLESVVIVKCSCGPSSVTGQAGTATPSGSVANS
jgi:hypothetical protein